MKRRFRPTIGGLVLENKGNSNNATASSNTTSTQPTRRARFKPKVGIVAPAQRSQGKTANQLKVSIEVPVSSTKPSGTKTASSPVGGNQTLNASPKRPGSSPVNKDGSQPSAGTNKITVTATVHSPPSIGQQPNGSGTRPSNGASLINKTIGGQADIVPESAGDRFSSSSKTSTLPVSRDVGSLLSTAQLPTDTSKEHSSPASKDIDNQPSSSAQTLSVNKSGASANQPSHGSQVNTVTVCDQISAQTNKDAASANASSPASGCSGTDTQKASCSQNKTTPNTTATVKPVRRPRIRPKVGIVSTKTPVEKSATKTPVERTIISEQTHLLPASLTVSSKDTRAGETPTTAGNEIQNINASPVKFTNTDNQALAGGTLVTKTSTKDVAASLETMCAQRKEPIKRTALTRRSRVTPNVRGKPSKAPAQKTVPENQSTGSIEVPSSATTPSDNGSGNSQLSTGTVNVNQSISRCVKDTNNISSARANTRSENVDATAAEKNSNIVDPPLSSTSKESEVVSIGNSEKTVSLQDKSSTNDESLDASNKERPKTSEKDPSNISISTNIASQNLNISGSEQTTATPASSQLTRRARFKPRVGIIGRWIKPQALSRNIAGNNTDSGQSLTAGLEKSVLDGTRSAQQNSISRLSRNVENRRSESASIVERGDENAIDNLAPDSTVGNEKLGSATSENGKDVEQEILQQKSRTSSSVTSENIQDQFRQTTGLADQSTSLAGDGLSVKRSHTVPTENLNSNSEQTETCSELFLSSDSKTSHESLQDVVILPQDDEHSSRNVDSSSASCLPVMMEDRSILLQGDVTCDGLPSGVEDPPELSTQMTAVVNMDDDLPHLYHLESADDLLQTLMNAATLAYNYAHQGNSGVPVDTSRIPVDMNRVSMDTTPNVHADPNTSITTPLSSTRLRNQTETLLNRPRTLPQSNQAESTLSKRQGPTSGNQTVPNNQAAPNSQAALNSQVATTSRLVIKRQRGRPKNKQQSLPVETSFLDISTIPIASNIEIELEIPTCDDIDHPVLELPVDLIQEDLTQSSPKPSTSSGGLKQRFQQRRSGAVKLVLSRKRSESSGVDKADTSSTPGGRSSTPGDRSSTPGDRSSTPGDRTSTPGDKSSTPGDRSSTPGDRSSTPGDRSSTSGSTSSTPGDTTSTTVDTSIGVSGSSAKSASNVGTETSTREITRKVRPGPNIQIRRKTSKPSSRKKSAAERIFSGVSSTGDNASTTLAGSDTVPGLEKDDLVEKQSSITNTSQEVLTNASESVSDVSKSSSRVEVSNNTATDNSTFIFGSETRAGVGSERSADSSRVHEFPSDVRHEFPSDIRSETELRDDGLEISDNVQSNASSTVKEKSGSGGGSDVDSQSSVAATSVHDLSKDDEIEIVLEVIGTGQGYCVCAVSDVSHGSVKRTRGVPNSGIGGVPNSGIGGVPNSGIGGSLTGNSGAEDVRTDPTSSSLPVSTTEGSLSNNRLFKRLTRSRSKDISKANSGSMGVMFDPKSSTPLHDVSSDDPESAFGLTSDIEFNNDSQDNAEEILAEDTNPMSSPAIQDISLNIPESAIEAAIRSTSEPLPNIVECSECPELGLCLTTIDDTSIDDEAHSLSQTQPGTLEDTVARATRRASEEFDAQELVNATGGEKTQTASEKVANGETTTAINEKETEKRASGKKGRKTSKSKQKGKARTQTTSAEGDTNEKESDKQLSGKKAEKGRSRQKPKPNIQRKRKARGKIVDDDEETTGGNNGSVMQEDDGNKGTNEKSGDDHLGVVEGTLEDTAVQDSSLGSSCVHEDGSLGDTCVQLDTIEEGGDGLEVSPEGSTPEVPSDPVQDGSSKKSGSRKRQSKAVKPKIPAKRTRKKAGVAQETESVNGCEETENPGETTAQDTEEASTAQKRKRGRCAKRSAKTTETNEQTETAPSEETPSKRIKNQRGKAGQDAAAVNMTSMRMCDMITYNPNTNPMTSENENETQPSLISGISSQSAQSETVLPATEDEPEENAGGGESSAVCAPRVTIDADGNIVLDEESLVIDSTPVPDNLDSQVVFENANQQYNAAHKRKNIDRWGKEETLYFYEVLSQVGTDFGLMSKLFPKRNRTEMKRKFKREEKINRDLIDKALSQRIPLAASLFADCLEETEEEMERSLLVQTAETAAQA